MLSRRRFLAHAAGLGTIALVRGQGDEGDRAGRERVVEGMRVCWCPPGAFTMGSPAAEAGRRDDEAPTAVTLTHGFWMGKFEVTQAEWRRLAPVAAEKPPSAAFGLGDDFPVYWVSYVAAEAFCRELTARARRASTIGSGWAFTLPTEAQWEYACRAGTITPFAFGDALQLADANFGPPPGEIVGAAVIGRATPVGVYKANAWGLCDMHGNLFEWCRDWYHARLPGGTDPDLSAVTGVPNRDGTYSRVRRGGAWNDPARFCRSALRLRYEPERSSDHIGFRVALARA